MKKLFNIVVQENRQEVIELMEKKIKQCITF